MKINVSIMIVIFIGAVIGCYLVGTYVYYAQTVDSRVEVATSSSDSSGPLLTPAYDVETTSEYDRVTIEDLTALLGMTIWKSRVNDKGRDPVTSFKLFNKTKGEKPKEIGSVSNISGRTGVVLLSMESVPENKLKFRLHFRQDKTAEGTSVGELGGVTIDNQIPFGKARVSDGAIIGFPGRNVLIQASGTNITDEEVTLDAEAVYVEVQ